MTSNTELPLPRRQKYRSWTTSVRAVEVDIPGTVDDNNQTYTVTSIGQHAFRGNLLTRVTIPNSVTNIGRDAFSHNPINTVRVERTDPPTLDVNAFRGANNIDIRNQINVVVPRGAQGAYQDTANGWIGFASITGEAAVGDTFTWDGIAYRITSLSPRTVEVTGRAGSSTETDITLPDTVPYQGSDFEVTGIGINAFLNNQLTSVTIGENVTSIGATAFAGNQLNSVAIPNSVTNIGISAFANNQLSSVTIPNSVTSIANSVFDRNNLTEVTIHEGVTDIGQDAFSRNPINIVLVERTDPPTLHVNAFRGPNNIDIRGQMDLVVPKGAQAAYQDPANGWTGFNSITEGAGVGDTFTWDGIAYRITSSPSPRTVEVTGRAASSTDTDITLPGTVPYQGSDFEVTSIGGNAFLNNQLTSVIIGENVTSIEQHAFGGNQLTSVTIPNSVTSIGNNAFFVNQLNSVTIGENVTSIGSSAFQHNQLTSIEIPNSVTSIGNAAFRSNHLNSVEIPNSVTSIGAWAFSNNALTEVTIPDGVISIGNRAFLNNPNLATVVAKGTEPPSIKDHTFTNADRNQIAVFVPQGSPAGSIKTAYENHNDWTGFASITEGIQVSIDAPAQVDNLAPFSVTITFIENVTGFTKEDINVINATADNFTPISGSTYTVEITPEPGFCDGTITIDVLEDVAQHDPNFPNLAASTTVTVNALPVAPSVSTNTPICSGENAIFTITGTAGDMVTYDDGASTGTVTIPAGGTATVTVNGVSSDATLNLTGVTNGNNCSVSLTETATVTVNSIPLEPTLDSTSPICSGENAVFTITGTAGDMVTYDDGASTGTVTIPAGGTAMVTVNGVSSDATLNLTGVTNGNNCSVSLTETATVTVNALPVAPSVSTNTPICAGENAVFTITGTAGDMVTYDDGTSTGTVNIPAGGTATVTVNGVSSDATLNLTGVTNGNNCSVSLTETATVTVNALPVAPSVSTNTPICSGENAIFTITGTAGDMVTYDDGTSTGTVTIPAGGTATVTVNGVSSDATLNLTGVTNGNCDISLTETATVMVNAIPSAPEVSSPVEYCVGETANALTATGTDLSWYTSPTEETGSATAPIPGTENAGSASYYVSQTTNSCESERAVIVVSVTTCPAQIGDAFTVSGMEYQITAVNPNKVEVIDYIGSATEVEIPETVDDNGETYTVTAIDANAFSDNPDLTTVKIEATHPLSIHEDAFADRSQINLVVPAGTRDDYLNEGWTGFKSISDGTVVSIEEAEKGNIILYPNPARDKVHIDPGPGQALKQVNIYTMTGAYLYSEKGLEINTSSLSEGMYLFEILTQTGNRSMKRVIIQ